MSFIYWIRHKSHTDIFSEGYVGFTSKTVEFRYCQHRYMADTGHMSNLCNALRKYGDEIIVETVLEGDSEYCLNVEYKLRSMPKTGWNAGIGGQHTMAGYAHSDATKEKMSNASPIKGKRLDQDFVLVRAQKRKALGLKHSDAARQKLSAARLNLNLSPWENPAANLDVWAQAEKVHDFYVKNIGGQYIAEKAFGLARDKLKKLFLKL